MEEEVASSKAVEDEDVDMDVDGGNAVDAVDAVDAFDEVDAVDGPDPFEVLLEVSALVPVPFTPLDSCRCV